MEKADEVLGGHVRVVIAVSEMVTATVSGFAYDGSPMDDLTRGELRLLVAALLGIIKTLGVSAGEERVLACIRSIALAAQRGSARG